MSRVLVIVIRLRHFSFLLTSLLHVSSYYRVGIELPTIEVRYDNLSIEADCYVGNRALPTLWNVTRNMIEVNLPQAFKQDFSSFFSLIWKQIKIACHCSSFC